MSFITTYLLLKTLNNNNGRNHYSGGDDLLGVMAIAGGLILIGGVAVGITSCVDKNQNETSVVEEIDMPTKTFEVGSHLISVPIDNPLDEAQRYEFHPGYKPVGIAAASYGKGVNHNGGSCILYVNDSEVVAKASDQVDEEFVYSEFGTPIDYEQVLYTEDIETFDFPAGTHILSIPTSDPTSSSIQYEVPEGYEPIGIATSAYGQGIDHSNGGCILYINTEEVTCKKQEDKDFVDFGTPKEKQKIKIKQ